MALAKGSLSRLSYLQETTFGETPTPTNFRKIPFTSESLDDAIERLQGEDIRSDRMQSPVRQGNHGAGGSITQDFSLYQHSIFMQHLLTSLTANPGNTAVTPTTLAAGANPIAIGGYYFSGTDLFIATKAGSVTGATITPPTVGYRVAKDTAEFIYCGQPTAVDSYIFSAGNYTSLPAVGLSIEKQILGGAENLYALFRGTRVNSLDLSINQRGNVKATWGLLSKDMIEGTSAYSTGFLNPEPFVESAFIDLRGNEQFTGRDCYLFISGIGASAGEVRPYRDLSINVTNAIDSDVYVLSENQRHELPEGTRLVSGRIGAYFKDRKEFVAFREEILVSMTLLMFHPTGGKISIYLPEVKLTGAGVPKISGSGVISQEFDFTSFVETGVSDIVVTYYVPRS